jgi:hypothetical protein
MRELYGPINEGGQWRIRTNAELQEMYREQDLVALIKIGGLRWLGHVERMDDNRVLKHMLVSQTRRKRPQLRWLDNMEEDLREIGLR